MNLTTTLPKHITNICQSQTKIALSTDLLEDGHYGKRYLVLTDEHIHIGSEEKVEQTIVVSNISKITLDEMYGYSRLLITINGKEECLINFSLDLINEFAEAHRLIDDAINGKKTVLPEIIDAARCPTCEAPLPSRGDLCPLCGKRSHVIKRILHLVQPYRLRAFFLILCTFIAVGAQMLPPYITKQIADNIVAGNPTNKLTLWMGLIAGAFALAIVGRLSGNWINSWLGSRIVADLRANLHEKVQRLAMSYHGRSEAGEIIGRMTHDTGRLQHFLIDGFPYFLVNSVTFIVLGIILLMISPLLTIFVLLPVPLLIGGGHWFWKKLMPLCHKESAQVGMLHSQLGESIRGVRAIKATGQENRRQKRFTHTNESLWKVRYRVEQTWFGFFEAMAFAMAVGTVGVWWLGPELIDDGTLTIGDLIAFVGYTALLYGPMQWFAAIFNWMTDAVASAERLFQVLDHREEDVDHPNAEVIERVGGAIEFSDVRFSYQRGKEILKGISFNIQAGEMIGLVGKSGSGKSTLINLLCRFFEPDSGTILIDGKALPSITYSSWRKQVGIVMQEPFLFVGSITDNIAYACPEASFEDVINAARTACAHDFILKKENGYDTIIGEGGVQLSGGEKQRIAIARAVLVDPPVLILDEATSAVDSETEQAIQEAIANLVKGRTTIAIAHRLATLREAHRLFVVDNGNIIEEGTHEELMKLENGTFANMVNIQQGINKIRSEQHVYD